MGFVNVYFSLGSNLGDRERNISEALRRMDEAFGTGYSSLSSLIETEPMGFSGGKFLNAEGKVTKDVMNDLLHPNEKGYQIWFDAILPTFRKVCGK